MTPIEIEIYKSYAQNIARPLSCETPVEISVAKIAKRYDAIFFDAFGTLYAYQNKVYPGALSMFRFFREQKKQIRLITNAATKAKEELLQEVNSMGFDFSLEEIFSSGEVFKDLNHEWNYKSAVFIGNESGKSYLRAAGITDFSDRENAVVITSLPGEDSLRETILKILSRPNAHLIVLNPDAYAPRIGSERVPVTGTYAYKLHLETGCRISYGGKPFPKLFQNALASLPAGSRTLMIGDTLGTDILGAQAAGIDSCLIPGRNMETAVLTRDEELLGLRPNYYLNP
ncbi:MAG: HAD-IIA family hydrolase [Fibrobacter sp.]|jgi:HAD superfamily hydrolase (TIGR01450 family)|nr:HAD-IIA family hydrolase [Fibrobacter sp.]